MIRVIVVWLSVAVAAWASEPANETTRIEAAPGSLVELTSVVHSMWDPLDWDMTFLDRVIVRDDSTQYRAMYFVAPLKGKVRVKSILWSEERLQRYEVVVVSEPDEPDEPDDPDPPDPDDEEDIPADEFGNIGRRVYAEAIKSLDSAGKASAPAMGAAFQEVAKQMFVPGSGVRDFNHERAVIDERFKESARGTGWSRVALLIFADMTQRWDGLRRDARARYYEFVGDALKKVK